jgi:CubicO group peptidase (beta-lactamase class C family)
VLLHEQLLKPLEMWDTKISLTAGDLERFAAHYWSKPPRVERQRWIFCEVCAFAGLTSTVPDLARFVSMHLNATSGQAAGPLRGISLLGMREPVATLGTDKTRGVTLGWFFKDHPRWGQILSHDGAVDGHSAALWLAPQVKCAMIVLANVGGDTAPRLNREIGTVVVGSVPCHGAPPHGAGGPHMTSAVVAYPRISSTDMNDFIRAVIAYTDVRPLGSSSRYFAMIQEHPCTAAITGIK